MKPSQHITNESGMAAVEFVLVFPLVFVSMLLVLELSFLAIDRHVLTSAALSAARTLAIAPFEATRSAMPPLRTPLSGIDLNPSAINLDERLRSFTDDLACDQVFSKEDMTRARRAAAFKMTATAPSVSKAFRSLGITLPELPGAATLGPMRAVLESYPMAYMLTRISQCRVGPGGVQLTITYLRHGKIPMAGRLFWVVHMLQRINQSTGESLEVYLKDDFFGLGLRSPELQSLKSQVTTVLASAEGSAADLGAMLGTLEARVPALRGLSSHLSPLTQAVAGQSSELTATIEAQFDAIDASLRQQESMLTMALYSVPDMLRTVPIKRSITVALTHQGYQRADEGGWKRRGFTYFIAPYQSESGAAGNVVTWEQWAKGLAETPREWKGR